MDFTPPLLPLGSHRLSCPDCSKYPLDKTLGITVTQAWIVWHCFRCGAIGSSRDPRKLARVSNSAPPPKLPDSFVSLSPKWESAWQKMLPLHGTAVAYLEARGCALPPVDGDVRCTEFLRHPSHHTGPALIARVTDALTGEPLTLHRTWIKLNGEKAEVSTQRLLLKNHRKDGGVIRLWPDEAITNGLGVAEGIETALTLANVFRPVWSVIDAGNLAKFPVLDGIESLLIAADNDSAGLKAAEQCASRWYKAGRQVHIVKSPVLGEDLNDLLRRTE